MEETYETSILKLLSHENFYPVMAPAACQMTFQVTSVSQGVHLCKYALNVGGRLTASSSLQVPSFYSQSEFFPALSRCRRVVFRNGVEASLTARRGIEFLRLVR